MPSTPKAFNKYEFSFSIFDSVRLQCSPSEGHRSEEETTFMV